MPNATLVPLLAPFETWIHVTPQFVRLVEWEIKLETLLFTRQAHYHWIRGY
jgi:hypothetical protein